MRVQKPGVMCLAEEGQTILLNSLKFATKYSKLILKQTATVYGSVTEHKLDTSKTEQEHIIPLLATDLL